jgi:NADH pyrophosphatase NudC (nudix superfamily)
MEKLKNVVGIAFIKDGKLLIVQSVRSSKNNIWTMVGGGVEDGESEVEAAIREVREEIHNGFTISEEDLKPVMCFKESASSDPNLSIMMTIFICSKSLDNVCLTPDFEILKYHWYKLGDTNYKISSAIRDHFIPFAVNEGLMY